MDITELLALFDRDQRIEVEYPGVRREVTPDVVRLVDTTGSGEGMVIHSRLEPARADRVIDEQVAYFEGLGQGFEWKVYDHDRPPALQERLAARGFQVEEVEAVMVLDLAHAPPVLREPVPPSVRPITEAEQLEDVLSVERQVWEEDVSALGSYLHEALRREPGRMSIYAAYVDGQPVSAAWVYFPARSRFASLWGGSTLPAHRGRGLYTALLAVRAQEARARGLSYLTVDASPMSRPILEKHGFERIAWTWPCRWKRRPGPAGAA